MSDDALLNQASLLFSSLHSTFPFTIPLLPTALFLLPLLVLKQRAYKVFGAEMVTYNLAQSIPKIEILFFVFQRSRYKIIKTDPRETGNWARYLSQKRTIKNVFQTVVLPRSREAGCNTQRL